VSEEAVYFNNNQKELILMISDEPVPSGKITLDVYDLNADAEMASKFNVDKAPGIVIAGKMVPSPLITGSATPASPLGTSSVP